MKRSNSVLLQPKLCFELKEASESQNTLSYLCLYVDVHTSFSAINHLPDIYSNVFFRQQSCTVQIATPKMRQCNRLKRQLSTNFSLLENLLSYSVLTQKFINVLTLELRLRRLFIPICLKFFFFNILLRQRDFY